MHCRHVTCIHISILTHYDVAALGVGKKVVSGTVSTAGAESELSATSNNDPAKSLTTEVLGVPRSEGSKDDCQRKRSSRGERNTGSSGANAPSALKSLMDQGWC